MAAGFAGSTQFVLLTVRYSVNLNSMLRSRLLWRLIAINTVAVLAFLALSILYIEISLKAEIRAESTNDLRARGQILLLLFSSTQPPTPHDIKELALGINARITLIGRDGQVLADSDADIRSMENHLSRPEVAQALKTGWGSDTRTSSTIKREFDYVAVSDPQQTQSPIVRVARPTEVNNRRLVSLRMAILATASALFLAGIVLSFVAARLIIGPVERIRSAAQAIAAGDFGVAIEPAGGRVFSDLETAFGSMSAQLKKRVEELEGQKRELASIMENVSDGLLLVDATGAVTLVNRAATRLLGQSSAQLEGKPLWQSLRHPEVNELLLALRKIDLPSSVRLETGTGTEARTIEIVATPLFETAEGEQRAVLLVRDRTEDKRLEQMRRDFVADVSHELKTPLTSIKAYVETLIDGAVEDPEARAPFLEKIRSNAERLAKLVSDILDISRLEGSPRDDSRSRLDLNLLVERVLNQFRERAQAKSVRLDFVPSAEPAWALVNDEDTSEAVENLLDNALKYTPEGGQVTASVALRDTELVISVADTGCGIPRESLPRVFERFYRVDRARSRALGGTGLGLSIVKHVALRQGGKVEAQSEEGKGSTFRIILPAA